MGEGEREVVNRMNESRIKASSNKMKMGKGGRKMVDGLVK